MRIAILSLPLHTNYGGILQSYALQTTLQKLGHEVLVLDRNPYQHISFAKASLLYPARLIRKVIGRYDYPIRREASHNAVTRTTRKFTDSFILKHINRYEYHDLFNLHYDFDCIIVGSDQIWRRLYNSSIGDRLNAFLKFTSNKDIKRLAYAASFGVDHCEYTQQEVAEISQLLKKFNAISVREQSGVSLCKNVFGVNAIHLLDPTMLMDTKDYVNLFSNTQTPTSSGDCLNYVLDSTPEIEQLIADVSKANGWAPFKVNSKVENRNAPLEERIQPPLEQWLRGFNDAKFVITDSFHACVFCILFRKPFVVVGNIERGLSRFESLLATFGLQDHLITNPSDFNPSKDYSIPDSVYRILEQRRSESIGFLKQNLHA